MEALGLDVLFMGSNATRLLQGLWVAVQISAISVVLSIILGMLFGIFMTWKNPVAKVISRLYHRRNGRPGTRCAYQHSQAAV